METTPVAELMVTNGGGPTTGRIRNLSRDLTPAPCCAAVPMANFRAFEPRGVWTEAIRKV